MKHGLADEGHHGDDEVVTRLLARLMSEPGENVPTGLFGRARRTASAALRTAPLPPPRRHARRRTAERLALSLGELKGIAMKVGQILSYLDTPLPKRHGECWRCCR